MPIRITFTFFFKQVNDIDLSILMLADDMLPDVALELDFIIITIRALEARHTTAPISEMLRQILLPLEDTAAVVIRARKFDFDVIGERCVKSFKRFVNIWKQKNKRRCSISPDAKSYVSRVNKPKKPITSLSRVLSSKNEIPKNK